MADFLASVDPLMPWHVTAFHPDYKMTDGYRRTASSSSASKPEPTTLETKAK